jgi:Ca-activated chloride channel family protein
MMKRTGILGFLLMTAVLAYGQNERKVIREGMKAYKDGEYSEAEVQFRRAEDINQESYEAEFNTGAALYNQEKYDETVKQYESLLNRTDDGQKTAQIWHNIGNSLLEAGQYAPSVEAYKNSLRKNPGDDETRYNLAYAQKMLKDQQKQQQNTGNDQKDQQDKKEGENKDQSGQQDQQDQQQNADRHDQQQDAKQDDPSQADQQPVPREISKEDAERLLQAIQQQEKDVKEKVDEKKAAVAKVKTEKDW